jgi:UDPglucose 6-dehydrogenase
MQLAIIGCGHVGLVTGGCLAAIGHQVICADHDADLVRLLDGGQVPIYEPWLDAIIQRSRTTSKLAFTSQVSEAALRSEIIFLCVGVPEFDNGEPDLSAFDSAARQIAQVVETPKLVVERSNVPVKTGEQLRRLLTAYGGNRKTHFRVAANPQFHRKGTSVEDFLHPDRILFGVEDAESEKTLRQLYAPILRQDFNCPVHPQICPPREQPQLLVTNLHSAELIKQASNAFLAVKISYANVLADLSERLGANVQEVTHAVGLDQRIGSRFLEAGIGFGGAHLPKDLQAFYRLAEREGVDAGILEAAEAVNRDRIEVFFEKVARSLWVLKDKRIAMLGLAHKADTDDIRGSRAIELFKRLKAAGAQVRAYDPRAMSNASAACPDLVTSRDAYEAADHADALLIVTEWDEFRLLDWQRMREAMSRPLVLDGRNLLSLAHMKSLGFEYHSVGRPV